jgi:hypothetical protein
MGILPKIESKSLLIALDPIKSQREEKKVCQRFMKRGNEPVI